MAPIMISDTEVAGVLKNVYSNFREKLFPLTTPLLANIQKGKAGLKNMRWGGNGVYFDVVTDRPVGMTANASGYFGASANTTEKQGSLGIKRLYVTRQIDGLAINGTQSKEAAYISLAKKVLEEAKDAATLGMQEIVHGDGYGVKALVSSRTDADTFVVTSPYGLSGAGQGGLLLAPGMQIIVLDQLDSTTINYFGTIASVTNSGDNATVNIAAGYTENAQVASGDKVVIASTVTSHSYNALPNGMINILNVGGSYNDLHSIDAGTYARWNTVRLTAGTDTPSLVPSEMDVWDLITKVAARSGKDAKLRPNEFLMITTPGIEKALAESFLGQRRFTGEAAMNLKGGFKALNICGLPLISDGYCPAGYLYLVHLPSLVWVDAKDWGQVQYESSGAWRFVSGRDAFEINWGAYLNIGTIQRNAHGLISGYTDTVRYTHVV